jgi:multiple sugar transport system permease protein
MSRQVRTVTRHQASSLLGYLAALVLVVVWILPYVWMILAAFKSKRDVTASPPAFLFTPTLDNFQNLFYQYDLLPAIFNSFVIVALATSMAMIAGTLAAYGLARLSFRGKNAIALEILSVRMLPPIATAVPLFLIAKTLGLLDTYWLIATVDAVGALPLVVWVMRVFFAEVPKSVEEAAFVDGCSRLGAMWRVVMPLVLPGVVATSVLTSVFVWNEFLFAVLLTGIDTAPVPIIVADTIGRLTIDWGAAAAQGALLSLPAVFPLMFLQRYLVRGLSFGSVKA